MDEGNSMGLILEARSPFFFLFTTSLFSCISDFGFPCTVCCGSRGRKAVRIVRSNGPDFNINSVQMMI